MDIIPILSVVILVATIVTLVIAITAYISFRLKEKERAAEEKTPEGRKKWFLHDLRNDLMYQPVILENYEKYIQGLKNMELRFFNDETEQERIDRLLEWSADLIDRRIATVKTLNGFLIEQRAQLRH